MQKNNNLIIPFAIQRRMEANHKKLSPEDRVALSRQYVLGLCRLSMDCDSIASLAASTAILHREATENVKTLFNLRDAAVRAIESRIAAVATDLVFYYINVNRVPSALRFTVAMQNYTHANKAALAFSIKKFFFDSKLSFTEDSMSKLSDELKSHITAKKFIFNSQSPVDILKFFNTMANSLSAQTEMPCFSKR